MGLYNSIVSEVVDVSKCVPKDSDRILVDTNVLLLYSYPKINSAPVNSGKAAPYLKFISESRRQGNNLCVCELSLSEIANVIEKTEHKIFTAINKKGSKSTTKPMTQKEFRLTPEHHNSLTDEIHSAWSTIQTALNSITVIVDLETGNSALGRLAAQFINGYDLFLLECMRQNKINAILTDDGGFCTVPDITLYTANQGVLTAAGQQGRLRS